MPRTRTFVAVDLGKGVRDRAVALQQRLARTGVEVKWVEPANLHVTLVFLGEVDDREIPTVCGLITTALDASAAFTIQVERLGCFPNERRPRIVWIGVGSGAAELVALHDRIEQAVVDLGFRREERKYTPHVTLGRVKSDESSSQLAPSIRQHGNWQGGEVPVREIHVMGSELTSRGPLYTVLSRIRLKG